MLGCLPVQTSGFWWCIGIEGLAGDRVHHDHVVASVHIGGGRSGNGSIRMSPALLPSLGVVHVGVARGAVHLVHGRGMVVLLGVSEQVRPQTQFYSVDFSQSRSGIKK